EPSTHTVLPEAPAARWRARGRGSPRPRDELGGLGLLLTTRSDPTEALPDQALLRDQPHQTCREGFLGEVLVVELLLGDPFRPDRELLRVRDLARGPLPETLVDSPPPLLGEVGRVAHGVVRHDLLQDRRRRIDEDGRLAGGPPLPQRDVPRLLEIRRVW